MSDYCYCDGEGPSVMHMDTRKARKEHKCCECRRTIKAGETYEYVWGIWEGDSTTYKTCFHCQALREYTKAHVPCFCWYYSTMRNDAMETLADYAGHAPGLWFGGARLYVAARRLRAAEQRSNTI